MRRAWAFLASSIARFLHRKGWLARDKDGKAYRYTAVASRDEYSARLMREAMAGAGDAEAVLSRFVAQMDGAESSP